MKRKNVSVWLMAGIAVVLWQMGTAPARAEVTDNESIPFAISVFVPCANGGAGEIVDVSGDLHVLLTFTVNGNNVSGKEHFQPQGVSGTGETTGDKYQATGVTQSQFKTSLQNGQAEMTFINNFRIIGQGPGNNFLVHETFHITINANGVQTAFVDNFSVDCK
jgi:hypothetical protein